VKAAARFKRDAYAISARLNPKNLQTIANMKISIQKWKTHKGSKWAKTKWAVYRMEDGKPKRTFFTTKPEAEAEADRLRGEVKQAGETWLDMPANERQRLMMVYDAAQKAGLDIDALIRDAKADRKASQGLGPALQSVIGELIDAKAKAGRREDYTKALRSTLSAFAQGQDQMAIGALGLPQVELFLNARPLVSRQTLRARLSTMFKFAMKRGYIAANPCDRLESITVDRDRPIVFTIEQLETCLRVLAGGEETIKHVKRKTFMISNSRGRGQKSQLGGDYDIWLSYRHALGWFTLTTFCGLRPEEAEAVEKSSINLKEGWVRVEKGKRVNASYQGRIVYPRPEALALLSKAIEDGADFPICRSRRRRAIRALKIKLGFKAWPKDITRHSAASYWLADGEAAATVAKNLGHSEKTLKKHYEALVTRAEAARFWAAVKAACGDHVPACNAQTTSK
jgi:integrase